MADKLSTESKKHIFTVNRDRPLSRLDDFYAMSFKQSQLQVRQGTLMAYGAVSEQVAGEMATGLRVLLHVDVAVSITSGNGAFRLKVND